MSNATDLADAIVGILNTDHGFSVAFQAARMHAPLSVEELEELTDVQVHVFIGIKKSERVTRKKWRHIYRPVIAIQKKLVANSDELESQAVDQLEQLAEEIETVFEDNDNADVAECSFISFQQDDDRIPYNIDALRDLKIFAVAIELEYVDQQYA